MKGPAVVEQELAAALRGGSVRPRAADAFVDAAVQHGLAPLLVRAGADRVLPPDEADRLRGEARRAAALAIVRDRELSRVLGHLHREGVPALLIKGAHLAHACYPCSYLRVRSDADLCIRERDLGQASVILQRLGYSRQPIQTGGAVLGQMLFDRPDVPGAALDLHWRLVAPRLGAALLDFELLHASGIPLPTLGQGVRGPSLGDALALACLHQVSHHGGQDLLIWHYDVHLLLGALTELEADQFARRVAKRGMTQICAAVIRRAAVWFPSARADQMLERLAARHAEEPSAALLQPRTPLRALLEDLRVSRWGERMRLCAGHLFPPRAYMRSSYAPGSRAPLVILYARRLWRGAPAWLGFKPGFKP